MNTYLTIDEQDEKYIINVEISDSEKIDRNKLNKTIKQISKFIKKNDKKRKDVIINTNLDLDITEFVTVNFEAVKEIVNDLGGVTITVTDAEATQISGINEAGTYMLNGDQALAYSRIRKIDTDYKRTERMRNVMTACLEKVKQMSVSELNAITDKVLPRIYTNIDANEIVSLIPTVASYKITESKGWPPTVEGKIINGVWYGVPVTLESSVKELHKELFDDDDYTPSEKVKEISEKIINKTGCGE